MSPAANEAQAKHCPHGEDPDGCDVCWAEGNEGEEDAAIERDRFIGQET